MPVTSPVMHRPAQTITAPQFTSTRRKADLLINLLVNKSCRVHGFKFFVIIKTR